MRWAEVALLASVTGGALGCTPSRAAQSAAQVGCLPEDITISEEAVAEDGYTRSVENWIAECREHRYVCAETETLVSGTTWDGKRYRDTGDRVSDVTCKEELGSVAANAPPPPPAAPSQPPPKNGLGFELGASTESARAACEGAGQTWQSGDDASATCSGAAVPLGFAAPVMLGLCGASVCSAALEAKPQTDWLRVVVELRSKLEAKYGPPSIREGEVKENCRSSEAFVACLKSRRVRLKYGWTWPSGETIKLLVGVPLEGGDAAIRLRYARPVATSGTVDGSAL